ncbi:hypothetical protein J3R83DRAFT_434 [Lanmaoa asiatica]|nr:hypothetical protein J3R83DRAFT_434 [Lanmaoa asiatica]
MASPPPNPDMRDLPYGWIQQYNWEFYVNTREQPPRSSWEHPLGPIPQGFVPPLGPPPPDRSYSRSPYCNLPSQGYGGYPGHQHSYGPPPQGYYNGPPGGHIGGPHHAPRQRVVYVEEERKHHKKGPGLGTAVAAGGAGLLGGMLLENAIESHNDYERDIGFDQGLGRGSARDPADDHRSINSADTSRNVRSPINVSSEVGVVTPAQAYASAVRAGETHDRTLYHTIERRQPERKRKADLQSVPSHPRSPERGVSFAQRLYASALSDKLSTLPCSNVPVLPPIKHAPSLALPTSDGSQVSCGVPLRETSLSTPLFDTSSEVSQSFNPSDLYHSSVVTHGFPSWGSTSPEVSATRPSSLLPALQIPTKSLPVARLTLQSGVQNPRPAHRQSHTVWSEAQSLSTPVVSIREASGLQGVSVETHQDFHPPAVAGGVAHLPSPLEQQLAIPLSSSPPPFEEREDLSNLLEEAVADVAPMVIRPSAAIPHEDGLPSSLLQPLPDANHEEVPLYSLVDEQLPPPAFDDLQPTNAIEASAEISPVVQPETSPQEVIEPQSSPSPPPSQSPPPSFSHSSIAYAPRQAPAYALLDKTSLGTSKSTLQATKIPLSSITTWYSSDPSSSAPPSVVPIDFQWPNQPSSTSPPISPSSAVAHDGTLVPSTSPFLPFHSRPLSVLSSHSPGSQSTRTSCDSLAVRKSATSSPPLVNYHTKPTSKQNGHPLLPIPALQRHDSQAPLNAADDNDTIDALTRSMSDMMRGPSSDTRSRAYENMTSGRPDFLGTSHQNQQNIPIILASRLTGTPKTISPQNQETYRLEAKCLIQEAYRQPTHAEISERVGYGIQGLAPANPLVATNILSLQHSPRTIPHPGPISPVHSHDELQTESFRATGDGSTFNHPGKTVALSASRSSHSDRRHIASVLPSSPFSFPLQPSHHSIDQGVHGPIVLSGSVPPRQQGIHSFKDPDPMKSVDHVFTPPPIALQPWNVSQTPQTPSYSQDSAKYQFGLGDKAPTLNSNDLARKFAHDALLAPSDAPAYTSYIGSNQR